MKKYLTVSVILLFIGLAFAPSIHANVNKEMVEFTTEVCGLDGGKQTVKLTQQEANEVDALFKSIRERLNETETRDEAEEIFKDAVVELDKYGLLDGLSVKQAQRILSLFNVIQRHKSISEMSENENYFCLISGKVTEAYFVGPIGRLAGYIGETEKWTQGSIPLFLWILGLGLFFLATFGFPIFPIRIGSLITIGRYHEILTWWHDFPSIGWILTIGLNGIKGWNGELIGELDVFTFLHKHYVGVEGFFGLRLYIPKGYVEGTTYILGVARKVKIDYWYLENQ